SLSNFRQLFSYLNSFIHQDHPCTEHCYFHLRTRTRITVTSKSNTATYTQPTLLQTPSHCGRLVLVRCGNSKNQRVTFNRQTYRMAPIILSEGEPFQSC